MIDYDKLKLAHELADKLQIAIRTQTRHVNGKYREFVGWIIDFSFENSFESLDDLIAKLQELTQKEEPKTKYAVGQRLFMLGGMSLKNIESFTVDKILPEESFIAYYGENDWWGYESELYPTKSALLEAQLKYWSELDFAERNKPIDSCCDPLDLKKPLNNNINAGLSGHLSSVEKWTECQHEWQTSPHFLGSNSPIYPHSCAKCGVKFDGKIHTSKEECQHEWVLTSIPGGCGKGYVCNKCQEKKFEHENIQIPIQECRHEKHYEFEEIDNCGFKYIKFKCKKCGEFYR